MPPQTLAPLKAEATEPPEQTGEPAYRSGEPGASQGRPAPNHLVLNYCKEKQLLLDCTLATERFRAGERLLCNRIIAAAQAIVRHLGLWRRAPDRIRGGDIRAVARLLGELRFLVKHAQALECVDASMARLLLRRLDLFEHIITTQITPAHQIRWER